MQNLREIHLENLQNFDLFLLLPLDHLTALEIDSCTVSDFSVLSQMTNLTRLMLRRCSLTDISFLAPLQNLRQLDLSWNDVRDLRPLGGMTHMRDLDLFGSAISDASPLLKMKTLRRLDMDFSHLTDMSILAQKPFSKLGVQVPDVPELEPADVRAERLRKKFPRVKKLCDIHSRVHFCRSAALVRLEDGMGRIALRQYGDTVRSAGSCDLFFDDQLLVTGCVESGTSTARLYAGYGNVMTDAECRRVRDALNANFESIDASLPALSPLLRLGTSVPVDSIRKMISEAREHNARLTAEQRKHLNSSTPGISRDSALTYFQNLQSYARLFPDSKWLTPEDRCFLEEDWDDPTWFPIND